MNMPSITRSAWASCMALLCLSCSVTLYAAEEQSQRGGGIAIPETVRRNLGITFVTVERRRVGGTLRVPGHFELLPTARLEYHASLPGRVELLVGQYDHVTPGQVLYRIDSPEWRRVQRELADAVARVQPLVEQLSALDEQRMALDEYEASLRQAAKVWEERVDQLRKLRSVGGGRAEELTAANAELSASQVALAQLRQKRAELASQRAVLEGELANIRMTMPQLAAHAAPDCKQFADVSGQHDLALAAAAALLDATAGALMEHVEGGGELLHRWRTIDVVEVRAKRGGVVEKLGVTNGGWVEQSGLVLVTADPAQLRFRGVGLQSDLGRLRNGLPARIVPPRTDSIDMQDAVSGVITLSLEAHPSERTLDLIVLPERLTHWTRPGVAANLEVSIDQTAEPELAIPVSCIVRDGLNDVFFRRDPRNPDRALRVEADLGPTDGAWVAVLSGVADGDQVVLDGAYELKLATSAQATKGGHFHSDGTFHDKAD